MAGTFPGLVLAQQLDLNGKPMPQCQLYVYTGASTTTPASVWQDIGLSVAAPWPLVADATGRLPLFFVSDGNFHLRLVDKNGVQQYDVPVAPSIGPSSTGSTGGAVDPTTVFSTGMLQWQPISGQLSGWVRLNGKTIGPATSGATEYANAAAQPLFLFLWNNFPDSVCPVSGGRGASALADWNAGTKTITPPDFRGRTIAGMDGMGNTGAGRLAGATVISGSSDTPTAYLGESAHTLILNEIPVHQHTGSTSYTPAGGITFTGGGGTGINNGGYAPTGGANSVTISSDGLNISLGGGVSGDGQNVAYIDSGHSHGTFLPGGNNARGDAGNTVNVSGARSSGSTDPQSTNITIPANNIASHLSWSGLLGAATIASHLSGSFAGTATVATFGGTAATISITVNNQGGGLTHNNVQPTVLGTFYMKL